MSHKHVVKTTGVIARHSASDAIRVVATNYDPDGSRTITVSIRDWTTACPGVEFAKTYSICNGPVQTSGANPLTVTLLPLQRVEIVVATSSNPAVNAFYDVIVEVSKDEDFTANTWSTTGQAHNTSFPINEGNTLFWKDWQRIERD